jgi:hypothetical protein
MADSRLQEECQPCDDAGDDEDGYVSRYSRSYKAFVLSRRWASLSRQS